MIKAVALFFVEIYRLQGNGAFSISKVYGVQGYWG